MSEILLLTGLFLIAGVLIVPLAARLKLGSVLGYIIAGIVLSPLLVALKVDVSTLQHFSEFGVVMMLFLVGLELEPKALWEMKSKLLGLGGLQVVLTIAIIAAGAIALQVAVQTALAIGFIFALSSTAIVLQTLNEKGLMKSEGGKSCFSVLLFQDIAVIPMLAIIPLLEISQLAEKNASLQHSHHDSLSLVSHLSAWQQTAITFLAIAVVIFGGIKLSRPFFRYAASARLREILVAMALLLVVAVALLMSLVELSPALGTFLAGVILANSEYRHELESNLEPFKGLLLGLFFITVGASIDFSLLFSNFVNVLLLTVAVMAIKAAVLLVISLLFKLQGGNRWLFTLGLAQAGEFAFVLLALTVSNHVVAPELADLLLLVVALSMLLTPALFILYEKFFAQDDKETPQGDGQTIEPEPIIIAGHGRFGGMVNNMLRSLGYQTTVLDANYKQLEILRKFKFRVYFGDATRPDLLHAAGIDKAKLFIIAIDNKTDITELARYCSQNYPHLHVIVRAVDRHHVYDLYAAGCRDIIRECFDSSIRAGRCALEALGVHPFAAERKARSYVHTDQSMLRKLAALYRPDVLPHENPEYVQKVEEVREENEKLLQGQDRSYSSRSERGWVPPGRKDVEAVSRRHN